MVKWEYDLLESTNLTELDRAGESGWEAVSVQFENGQMFRVLVKRLLIEKPESELDERTKEILRKNREGVLEKMWEGCEVCGSVKQMTSEDKKCLENMGFKDVRLCPTHAKVIIAEELQKVKDGTTRNNKE